ncbi:MAG: glycoside hydrolase family 20 zincin-like fold domain-containing protein, partial [Bacteroidota bacterium]
MKTNFTFFRLLFLSVLLIIIASVNTNAGDIYTLHPKAKFAYEKQGSFTITKSTKLYFDFSMNDTGKNAVSYFQNYINTKLGDTLKSYPLAQYNSDTNSIIIGVIKSISKESINKISNRGEQISKEEGYLLDISPKEINIIGFDEKGTHNALLSLIQLATINAGIINVKSSHLYDYPDYSNRWVFSMHNLRGSNAMTQLKKILDTMVTYKLNGIQHVDFKYNILKEQPAYYFDSVARFSAMSSSRNIEIIPGVASIGWSGGLLWNDPNLAEGIPTNAVYNIIADTGRIVTDVRANIPNGGFENVDGNGKFTGWSFYDD